MAVKFGNSQPVQLRRGKEPATAAQAKPVFLRVVTRTAASVSCRSRRIALQDATDVIVPLPAPPYMSLTFT
ncbi:hypothetical protein PPNSA23_46000 [Phyllobacterium phragmitis]|uniref:Uncharacterized protein n=1 Tax=Phyllobacterium phragmitis TaxID=2670329 RepID=A0ABQ0H6X3_9HYPH